MQTVTYYIKLFAIFMTMTLFSSYLYGADIKKINEDKNKKYSTKNSVVILGVKEISNATTEEETYLIHEVKLTAVSSTPVQFTFSIEDNTTTKNKDYNPIPTFDQDINVSYDDNSKKITVGAGIDTFNIKIKSLQDIDEDEIDETYTIRLGNKSAIGTIKDSEG